VGLGSDCRVAGVLAVMNFSGEKRSYLNSSKRDELLYTLLYSWPATAVGPVIVCDPCFQEE
jgi:hypothetical protein